MDMLDKIIIGKWWNNEKHLFEIELSNHDEGDTIFEFREFEKVEIQLCSNSNSHLEIEMSNSDEVMIINPGIETVLNDFEYERDNVIDNSFIPEKYLIKYVCNECEKLYYFKVLNNALGENIKDIRKIINEFSNGLELDFQKKIKSNVFSDVQSNYYMSIYQKISNEVKVLITELGFVIDHPNTSLKKDIRYTSKPIRLKEKSTRYLIKKNIDNDFNIRKLEELTSVSIENRENVLLKNELLKLLKICKELELYFVSNIEYLTEKYPQYEMKKNELTKKVEKFSQILDYRYKNTVNSELLNVIARLNDMKSEIERFDGCLFEIRRVHNYITWMFSETWMSDINERAKVQNVNTRNIHYKRIIDIIESLKAKAIVKSSGKIGYNYRMTSELYEIYVLILLFNILTSIGFYFDYPQNYDFNTVFNGHEFVFKKDNSKIKIIYDEIVSNVENDVFYDCLANQNSSSNKPDIVFMIYEDDSLKNALIFEVKCRKLHSIYTSNGDTKVFRQLRDYTNFWYFDKDGKINKSAISKVYTLYPSEDNVKKSLNANQIVIISLNPIYDFENDQSFLNLKEEILYYL